LNAANTLATVNEVKIALQEKIADAREALSAAQEAQAASLKRIDELEQEIVRLKDWEADKQRYELKALDTGAFAYKPKPGMENGEPPHWACANCYKERKVISILQEQGHVPNDGDRKSWHCANCRASIRLVWKITPEHPKDWKE